jgi:ribA/ribD-fused uncharacterized protein
VKRKDRQLEQTNRESAKEIRFYRANEKPYGALSNLFPRPIFFEEQLFPTSEHAYQAGKPRKESVRKWLMSAPAPSLVAMAAHGLYIWDIRADWNKIKFERMRAVLRAKFTQHADLRELLLSTGDARLVEWTTVDNPVNRTWGEVNGKGRNMLGILLMELRTELKHKAPTNINSNGVNSGDVQLLTHPAQINGARKKFAVHPKK